MNKYNRISDEPTPIFRSLVKYLPIGAMSTHAILKSLSSMQSDAVKQSLAEDFNGKTTEIAKAVVNNRQTSEYISKYYTGNHELSLIDIVEAPLNHAYAFGDAFADHLTLALDNPYVLAGFIMSSTIATTTLIKAEESRRKGKENAFFYKDSSSKILKDSLESSEFKEYKKMGKYLTRGSNIISQLAIDIRDSDTVKGAKNFVKRQFGLHTDSELTAIAINNAIQDMYINKSGRLRSRTGNILISEDLKRFNDPSTSIKSRTKIEKRLARTIKKHNELYKQIVGLELGSDYRPKYFKEISEEKAEKLSISESKKYEKDMTYKAIMDLRAATNPLVMEELKARGYTAESLIEVFKEHLEAAFETDKQLTKIFPHETQVINDIIDGAGKKLKLKSHANALASNIYSYYRLEESVRDQHVLTPSQAKKLGKIKANLTKISKLTHIASREPVYHELELIAQGVLSDIETRSKKPKHHCLKTMIGNNTDEKELKSLFKSKASVMDQFVSNKLARHGYEIKHDDNELDYMSTVMNEKVIKYLDLRVENQARDLSDYYTKKTADDDSVRLNNYFKKKDFNEKCLYATGLGSVGISVAMAYDPTLSSLNIFGEATSISNVITHISSAISNPAYLAKEFGAVADIISSGSPLQLTALTLASAVTAVGFVSTVRSCYLNRMLDRKGYDIQRHKSWDVIKKYVETNIYDDTIRKNEVFANSIRNSNNIIQRTVDKAIKAAIIKTEERFSAPLGFEDTLKGKLYKKFIDVRDGIYCPVHESVLEEMDDEYIRRCDIIRQILVDDGNELGADIKKLIDAFDPDGHTFEYFTNNFDDVDRFLKRDEFLLEKAFKQELSLENLIKPLIKDINKLAVKFNSPEFALNDHMAIEEAIFKDADKMANLHIRTKAFARLMGDSYNNKIKLANTVSERDLIKKEMDEISDKDSLEYQKLIKAYKISAREIEFYVNNHNTFRDDLEAFRHACTGFSGYDDEYKPLAKVAEEYAKVYYGNHEDIDTNLQNFKETFGVEFKESEIRAPHATMDYIIAPIFKQSGYDIRWQASEYSYLAKAASHHLKSYLKGISAAILEDIESKDKESVFDSRIDSSKEQLDRVINTTPLGTRLKGRLNPEDFIREENSLTRI